jgi:hypothetical protein
MTVRKLSLVFLGSPPEFTLMNIRAGMTVKGMTSLWLANCFLL